MSARGEETPDPESEASERLVSLAMRLLTENASEDVVRDLGAIRAEVDRAARLLDAGADEADLVPTLREALGAAGLGDVAPAGARLGTIQAALRRLHGQVTALAVTGQGRARLA